jgi:hypothetical protein
MASIESCGRYHQNSLFEWVLEAGVHLEDPWEAAINPSAETNNLFLLLKCIDHGADVNKLDSRGVFLNLTGLHCSMQRNLGTQEL